MKDMHKRFFKHYQKLFGRWDLRVFMMIWLIALISIDKPEKHSLILAFCFSILLMMYIIFRGGD